MHAYELDHQACVFLSLYVSLILFCVYMFQFQNPAAPTTSVPLAVGFKSVCVWIKYSIDHAVIKRVGILFCCLFAVLGFCFTLIVLVRLKSTTHIRTPTFASAVFGMW